jgi:nucleotide-binding universal stress UspA family protein
MRITRVVCGIEPVGRGVLAAGQAARLAPEDAPVVLVGAADVAAVGLSQPIGGDIDMGPMPVGPYTSLEELERSVREELERAAATLGGRRGVATRIEVGGLAEALDHVSAEDDGSLLALDAPQEGRLLGIIDGEPATWLLHESARPLLLARGSRDDRAFPRSVAVGVDGSAPAAAAAEAAGEIAQRCGAGLRLVIASGGRGGAGPLDELRARLPPHELVEDPKSAVHALNEVDADLVVVGSRGLHGLRALGSVSERVAHGSRASVLVVR